MTPPFIRPTRAAGALAACVLVLAAATGCRRTRARARPTPRSTASVASVASVASARRADPTALLVPRADPPPRIDGELGEAPWPERSARTRAFVDEAGHEVHPYSDARFLWHPGFLDLALYAADQDIHPATDAFVVVLRANGKTATLRFGPKGLLPASDANAETTATSAATKVGVDVDGTYDDPSDEDEEWVIESSLPLAPLGLTGAVGEELSVAIERCDVPKGTGRVCGHYGTQAAPKLLRLQ